MDFEAKRKQQAELLEEKRLRLEKLRREKEERNNPTIAAEASKSTEGATISPTVSTTNVDSLVDSLLQNSVAEDKKMKIERLRRERAERSQGSSSAPSTSSARAEVDDLVNSLLPQANSLSLATTEQTNVTDVSSADVAYSGKNVDPLQEKRKALSICKAVVQHNILPKSVETYNKECQTDATDFDHNDVYDSLTGNIEMSESPLKSMSMATKRRSLPRKSTSADGGTPRLEGGHPSPHYHRTPGVKIEGREYGSSPIGAIMSPGGVIIVKAKPRCYFVLNSN